MRRLPAPATVWHTLRYLRQRQIRYQIAKRVRNGAIPPPLPMHWRLLRPKLGRAGHSGRSAIDGVSGFRFNNESRVFSGKWNDPSARKLWLYNLHYMGWLFDLEAGREEWIRRWIRENPPGIGNGWEPYPTSLRLFNWCRHFCGVGVSPGSEILASIELQTASLMANLEFHLDGNHLLENLLAVAFAGFFLDVRDARAERARRQIGALLDSALREQFLEDGGHYELSPMYHAILLERILDLLDAWPSGGDGDPYPGLEATLRAFALRALDWLDTMTVAGRFSLFNDSAYDAAPEASRLLEFGGRLLGWQSGTRVALRPLATSGYYRAEAGPSTLIFDGGLLGPDHQMGHAQGDMLSFCLWMRDIPILVHPGNYEYAPGPMRDFCRSTAAHNTLVMDGSEQAEWWAAHRVGWRGRPMDVTAVFDPARRTVRLGGAHDGFRRLPGRPIHRRSLELTDTGLIVRDEVTADPSQSCRIHFHIHPECAVERENDRIRIRSAAGSLVMASDHPIALEDSWHCPEFGLRIPNRDAVVEGRARDFRTIFTFEL